MKKPSHVIGNYGFYSSSQSSHSSGSKSEKSKKGGNPNGFSLKKIREDAKKKVMEIAKRRKWLEQPRRADLIRMLNEGKKKR